AEMYEISNNGNLGKLIHSINNGWRKTWTDIEYYQSNGKNMLLFYEKSTGSAEMYEISNNGNLGKLIHSINNGWRKTWSDIEYYNAHNQNMILFYERSTGSAEIYSVANNGILGKLENNVSNDWRTTWSNIVFINSTQSQITSPGFFALCTEYGEQKKPLTSIVNHRSNEAYETSTLPLVVSTNSLWKVGQTIKVSMDNAASKNLKEKILEIANRWTLYANVKFSHVESNGDIHIKFDPDLGYSSLVGNQSVDFLTRLGYDIISRGTMNLAVNDNTSMSTLERVVLHEFGHALGFQHEHQNPSIEIPWNKEAIYKLYKQTMGWDKDEVDHNVFRKLDAGQTQFTSFDPNSIMLYSIPNSLTIGNFSTSYNTKLSDIDKSFASIMYPFANKSRNSIRVIITTGNDDLREKSNANFIIKYRKNSSINEFQVSLNRGKKWDNNSTHSKDIPLPDGVGIYDIVSVTLFFATNKRIFTDNDDNWKVNKIKLDFIDATGHAFPLMQELKGTPYIFFIGKSNPYLKIDFF
uniref:matrixin family metalloprotease n=1 Tax=uncultured Psychroserpens sp. TaxID=255436 RepID=UPI002604455D